MATEAQVEQIREATNIVDLVGEHVRLKKRGRNFQGELLSLVKLPHRMAVSPHTGKAVAAKR